MSDNERGRLKRRLFVLGFSAGTAAAAQPAEAQVSDNDPYDPSGRGRGRPYTGASDSDPRDRAGHGRPRTGTSDSDPRDRAGYGRPQTGYSDSDPRDPAGRGRPQTGRTDSDPRDPPGRGRY